MKRPADSEFERKENLSLAEFDHESRQFGEDIEAVKEEPDEIRLIKHDTRTGEKMLENRYVPARALCEKFVMGRGCIYGTLCSYRHTYSHGDQTEGVTRPRDDGEDSGEVFDAD